MDKFAKGWFTEASPEEFLDEKGEAINVDVGPSGVSWGGQAFSLKVTEVLFHEKSKFQDVLVFRSERYGVVLALDSIIQCTEKDEFVYHEMLAHLAMFNHVYPKKVLIIGGGDGGVLKEVLKHKSVESVTLCEIDECVINVCRKYFDFSAPAFNDPRTTIVIGDGFEFLKKYSNEFDVIITDSSDPIGPAKGLFGLDYYKLVENALKQNGVLSSQGECLWLDTTIVCELWRISRETFPSVGYATSTTPTYPSGYMGYLVATKQESVDLSVPCRLLFDSEQKEMKLKYYDSEIHRAAFVLPVFMRKILQDI